MASAHEQVMIANNFLLSAPPGEFFEVVTDVRALLPDESMLNDTAEATFKKYNHNQMIQVTVGADEHKFLVCGPAEVAENEYFDPASNEIHTFNHLKQEVEASRPVAGEIDESMEAFRKELQAAGDKYTKEKYPFGTCGVYSKDGKYVLCINSTRFSPQNFWNGRWRSVWEIPQGRKVTMKGVIQLQVHYYEDGNVQLNTKTERKIDVDTGAGAEAVVKAILECEQRFHQDLDSSYNTMGSTTFKALRRVLPVSGEKVRWESIMNYKVGDGLGRK